MGSQRSWQGLNSGCYRRTRCLLVFLFLTLPLSASATTYYVDNCVTVGSDSNNGTATGTPWLTINKVKTSSFNAGDSVLFQRTCIWREQLTPPSSGSAGNVITYGAYGSGALPQILGSISENSTGNWTNESGNLWYTVTASVPTAPNAMWRDTSALMTAESAKGSLTADGQWWYDSANTRVYLYSVGNPASSHTFEIPQRDYAIRMYDKSYVTIQDLDVEYANVYNVFLDPSSGSALGNHNIILNGLTALHAAHHNICMCANSNETTTSADNVIENSEVGYSGWTGIAGSYRVDNLLIQNNNVHHAALDPSVDWTGGIRVVGGGPSDTSLPTNVVVQYNVSSSNGIGGINRMGTGIHMDTMGAGTIIRYNLAYDNRWSGIDLEISPYGGGVIEYNVSYGNRTGIYLDRNNVGSQVIGNTTYNNGTNLIVMGEAGTGAMTNNIIKNNIASGGTTQLEAETGGQNDGTNGSGNVYTYNSFGTAGTNFINWGASNYSTYASWEAATGNCGTAGCSHSIQTAPTFTNAAGGDFTLAAGSSAIAAGLNLGSTYQMGLNPVSSWPSPVSTLNQNSYGSAWEIGAFVFVSQNRPAPPTSLSVTVN